MSQEVEIYGIFSTQVFLHVTVGNLCVTCHVISNCKSILTMRSLFNNILFIPALSITTVFISLTLRDNLPTLLYVHNSRA